MKYYIIAGEASGDLHASNLMKALKELDQRAEFRCWGGDLMKEQGGELVKHYTELSFMGFLEVLLNIVTIIRNIKLCKRDLINYHPNALILVDYPGFNLRIAKYAKQKGLRVFYYISPKVWAWNQKRAIKIKQSVDQLFTIFPFETEFFKKYNFEVNYVGHPLLDAIDNSSLNESSNAFIDRNNLPNKPIIALLPGSRKQEVKRILSKMISIRSFYPDYQFIIGGAPSLDLMFYKKLIPESDVPIVFGETYNLLRASTAALVTSGTATLETALFRIPQVVCYETSFFSYWIAKQLIQVKYISLVNLIMDMEVVKELIQKELNSNTLKNELDKLLLPGKDREKMLSSYDLLIKKLGTKGASQKVAKLLLKTLDKIE